MADDSTPTPDSERYVGKPELRARYQLDPATILRKVRDGLFPAPVYIFGRARWRITDLVEWEGRNVSAEAPGRSANLLRGKARR